MSSMKEPNPIWGYWIAVKDEASAKYAAKMSGLLVFLLGVQFIGFGLFILSDETALLSAIMVISGLFLLVSGLMIRKGRIATLPISVGLWSVLTLFSICTSFVLLNSGGRTQLILTFVFIVINAMMGLLAISGLRGWWWLRKNKPE